MERGDIIKWGSYYGVILSRHEHLNDYYRATVVTNYRAIKLNPAKKPRFLGLNLQEAEMELVEKA